MQSYAEPPQISKVETHSGPVKTHSEGLLLAENAENVYYCVAMRILGRIAYWLAAVALLATILTSLDYTLAQAILIGLTFCPCALALEFLMPMAKKPVEKVYLSLAVMLCVFVLILILHYYIWSSLVNGIRSTKDVAPMLINPAFLGLILTVLAIGDYYWAKWLSKRFKPKNRTITFFSDRRSVTLPVADIAYIESNDTEVRVVTVSGETHRNKTGISQWENLLGDGFLRIHRSYLVNTALMTVTSPDTVTVGVVQRPVSRKYKETVHEYASERNDG